MKSYARKIINHILKKRSDSLTVCYEPESKVQADSDRSDIRMFEIGMSAQRHGDYRKSTRTAEEEESLRIINTAKEHGLYIDKKEWYKFGDRRSKDTGESIVYLSHDELFFTKIKSPFAKGAIKGTVPADIIYEHLIHNILFPNTRYRFIGISEDLKGIRIILQQRNIGRGFRVPTQEQIDDFLTYVLKLKKEDNYFYGNEYLSITDVSNLSDNVLLGDNGELFFIDPIIKLKKSAIEILNHLYMTMCK